MLPSLPIQAPVSKFVIGGADFFLPGVAVGVDGGLPSPDAMPDFERGALMLITCIGESSGRRTASRTKPKTSPARIFSRKRAAG